MKRYFPFLLLFVVSVFFFHRTIFLFQVPFPGDLLISTYSPWKYESYLGYNPGSYPDKAQYFDVIRQLYPWKILAIDQWKSGEVPLWNPYSFSGTPLLANNQSSVFYPGNILFFLFDDGVAWSLYIFSQPLLASIFMYIFIRSLRLSKIAALIAAASYSYSLFMTTFLEYGNFGHTILWLPLLLYIVEKIKVKPKKNLIPIVSLTVAAVIFAGHFQIATGVLLAVLVYGVVRLCDEKRQLLIFLTAFFLGVGIGAIQLLPTFELLALSARVAHAPEIINNLFLLKPEQLILLLIPDIYGNPATRNYLLTDTYPGNAIYLGIIPILFFVSAIFKRKKEQILKIFLMFFVGLILIFVNNPVSTFIFNLPIFSASSPSNYFFLLTFCISVVAGYGVDIKLPINKKLIIAAIIVFSFLAMIGVNAGLNIQINRAQVILSALIIVASIVAFFLFRFGKYKFLIALPLIFLVFELFYFFAKFNPFVPQQLMYPQTPIVNYLKENIGIDRYIGRNSANIEPNYSVQFRLMSPDGYDPLYPKTYNVYTKSNSRSDALLKLEQKETLNALSVRLILDRVENASDQTIFPPEIFRPIYSSSGWIVYENKNALPRAFIRNKDKIIPVKVAAYTPSKVVLENKKASGRLILTDTYYPGWIAKVDGQKREIEQYDKTLRSVQVFEDDKTIIFEYKPQSFYKGLIITIISLVGMMSMLFIQKVTWKK